MNRLAAAFAALLLLVAGLAPAPARAHWENTRWGMTPAQVKALYPAAKEVPARPGMRGDYPRLRLEGPIKVRDWNWKSIEFRFERGGKLTGVSLVPTDGWDEQVKFYAGNLFGEPVEIVGDLKPEVGIHVFAYQARFRSARTGDEGLVMITNFMGDTWRVVEIVSPDPVATRTRLAARRLKQLRDSGAAPPPAGGWNNTRWTMTRDQVLALYPTLRQDSRGRLRMDGPFTWQGRSWSELAFEFQSDYGLAGVRLWTDESQLAALEAETSAHYGPPTRRIGKPPAVDEFSLYFVLHPPTAAGEEVYVFSSRVQSDRGTGLRIGAPDDTRALNAALAAPDPGPPPPELRWSMTPAEFLKVYPSASNGADTPFYVVMSPSLHGRTWKRAVFQISLRSGLDAYNLFSIDSYDAILAAMTSRYGPPTTTGSGWMTYSHFRDTAARAFITVERARDGTAIVRYGRMS